LFVGGGAVFGFEEYGEEGSFGAVNRNGTLCVVLGIQIKFVGVIQNTGTQIRESGLGNIRWILLLPGEICILSSPNIMLDFARWSPFQISKTRK
jgi:hypothetical protein